MGKQFVMDFLQDVGICIIDCLQVLGVVLDTTLVAEQISGYRWFMGTVAVTETLPGQ